MKILTVCQRGNCRSVATAYILKDRMGVFDAIAMGVETASPETQKMLLEWADKIIVVGQKYIYDKVPKGFEDKMHWLDIGPDVWRNPTDENLLGLLYPMLEDVINK